MSGLPALLRCLRVSRMLARTMRGRTRAHQQHRCHKIAREQARTPSCPSFRVSIQRGVDHGMGPSGAVKIFRREREYLWKEAFPFSPLLCRWCCVYAWPLSGDVVTLRYLLAFEIVFCAELPPTSWFVLAVRSAVQCTCNVSITRLCCCRLTCTDKTHVKL